MRICLDGGDGADAAVAAADGGAARRRGEETGFSLVLDEQWRGTGSTPSMKMV